MLEFSSKMEPNKIYSREDYESFFNDEIKERTARDDLQKLTDGGWIKKIGGGPHTRYSRTPKILPDFAG